MFKHWLLIQIHTKVLDSNARVNVYYKIPLIAKCHKWAKLNGGCVLVLVSKTQNAHDLKNSYCRYYCNIPQSEIAVYLGSDKMTFKQQQEVFYGINSGSITLAYCTIAAALGANFDNILVCIIA